MTINLNTDLYINKNVMRNKMLIDFNRFLAYYFSNHLSLKKSPGTCWSLGEKSPLGCWLKRLILLCKSYLRAVPCLWGRKVVHRFTQLMRALYGLLWPFCLCLLIMCNFAWQGTFCKAVIQLLHVGKRYKHWYYYRF